MKEELNGYDKIIKNVMENYNTDELAPKRLEVLKDIATILDVHLDIVKEYVGYKVCEGATGKQKLWGWGKPMFKDYM